MSSFVKYKIREVAKDFDIPAKTVVNMITEHFEAPKSTAQVLTDDQLNLVFDLITKENQIASMEEVFATAMQAPEKKEEPKPQQAQQPKPKKQHREHPHSHIKIDIKNHCQSGRKRGN